MREIIYQCENKKSVWTGTIQITEETENSIIGKVEAGDYQFLIVLSRYYHGYGMEQWCLCVPDWNFGCKVSTTEMQWNMEQFRPYIKNQVDRISLAQAVGIILAERRLDGCTFAEIGKKFGVSRQCVEQTLRVEPRRKKSQTNSEKCIYKGLANYISNEEMALYQLSSAIGLSSINSNTISKKITGKRKFNITEIKKILELTGLSFEECFCEKDAENERR